MAGIRDRMIQATPIAVVDIETTGLHPAGDRVVEIAVARVEPGQPPVVVLDTLVNPQRPMAATEIHGITEDDVRGAPTFSEIAPVVSEALSGCVFAAYNVYFDAKFIAAELGRSGITRFPPRLCLMYMRPLLNIGSRCSLGDACDTHGIRHEAAHMAADDALASAQLWQLYTTHFERRGIRTFADLAAAKSYKFLASFGLPLIDTVTVGGISPRMKSRRGRITPSIASPQKQRQQQIAEYWDALKMVLADLSVEQSELQYLQEKRRSLQLSADEIRSLHARAFSGILADVSDDHALDATEVEKVARLADALRALGWSPGDRLGTPAARPLPVRQQSWLTRILGR